MMDTCVKTVVIKENDGWYSLLVRIENGRERLFRELTRDLCEIRELSKRINCGDVSPLHIDDIIEDFLP